MYPTLQLALQDAAPKRRMEACDVVLVGPRGQVGTAFRELLVRQKHAIAETMGINLRLRAAFDRHGMARFETTPTPAELPQAMRDRHTGDIDALLASLSEGMTPFLIIDCTASDEIADCYADWMSRGIGIVAANKRANARGLAYYQKLRDLSQALRVPYRYETTVAAAVPLLRPLQDLRLRGERVIAIRGVLSGSLSYIMHRIQEGALFSDAVLEAQSLGYTEPDPMEDLAAVDLSRKLLVLAREAGFMLEPHDLHVEPLCQANAADERIDLPNVLRAQDATWKQRVIDASARDQRLVIVAEVDIRGARVQLQAVERASQFALIKPGQNVITIETDLQAAIPLTVSGPGAGIRVTAAGVLSDVVAAAAQLAGARG